MNESGPAFDLAQDGWKALDMAGFFGLAGPLWTRREDDVRAYGFLADARHVNPSGVVHGGMLTTLIDQVLSMIAWEANGRRPCVTIQLDMQFIAPVHPGQFVVVRGEIVRQTGSLVFMQGQLAVAEGTVAAAGIIIKLAGQGGTR